MLTAMFRRYYCLFIGLGYLLRVFRLSGPDGDIKSHPLRSPSCTSSIITRRHDTTKSSVAAAGYFKPTKHLYSYRVDTQSLCSQDCGRNRARNSSSAACGYLHLATLIFVVFVCPILPVLRASSPLDSS